jgi:CheY-like chemotaxis protein
MKPYSKTIVCVDDDMDDLMMLRQALQAMDTNHQVLEAFDGLHALELLHQLEKENQLPCLIVLDINMPRMDGRQTLLAIQGTLSLATIPVVLFSTSSSQSDKSFCETQNVQLLTKPFDCKSLYSAAGKLLSFCNA